MPICGPCGEEQWKRQATSEAMLPKGKAFHYAAQNNSRQPLRWNDALFFETICGKFRIMKIYFYRWHSPPCLELPPTLAPPPSPWLLLWAECGNSRSQYRGQPAGHCYSRAPSGSLFLLLCHAIRDRETKDAKWRLVAVEVVGHHGEGTEGGWKGTWVFHPKR